MNRLIAYLFLVLVLTLSLQFVARADDISEFEIARISIGTSMLSVFTNEEIKDFEKIKSFKDKKYSGVKIYDYAEFEEIQLMYLSKDKKKIINGISAIKNFDNNLKACRNERKSTIDELRKIFKSAKLHGPKTRDHVGNSKWEGYAFIYDSGDMAVFACYFSNKNKGFKDHMRVSLRVKDYDWWLVNRAYK